MKRELINHSGQQP